MDCCASIHLHANKCATLLLLLLLIPLRLGLLFDIIKTNHTIASIMLNRIIHPSIVSRSFQRTKSPKSLYRNAYYSSSTMASSSAPTTTDNNSGFFSKLTGSSSDKPPSDQYAKQIYDMSRTESWTLSSFSDQIKTMSGGWKSKLPFVSNTEQVKQVKRMQALIDATVEVLGADTKLDKLKDIGKKEKVCNIL